MGRERGSKKTMGNIYRRADVSMAGSATAAAATGGKCANKSRVDLINIGNIMFDFGGSPGQGLF